MQKSEPCQCARCQGELCTRRVPIFSSLNDEELTQVAELIVRRKYEKNDFLVMKGSNLEGLMIINKGKVKAFRNTPDGKEQILYIFSEGDFFGEKNLLQDRDVTYTVEALEETNTCMIRKKDFHQLLHIYPDIGLKVLEQLCDRLYSLENALESMGTKSVEARINAVLLEFAQKYGKKHAQGIQIELPLSREGIANYLGLTRETVSRKLSLMQDEGVISMVGKKKIIIIDLDALSQHGY